SNVSAKVNHRRPTSSTEDSSSVKPDSSFSSRSAAAFGFASLNSTLPPNPFHRPFPKPFCFKPKSNHDLLQSVIDSCTLI
ncbi:unnamed protein product, partial [Schistosoma margrebowiei]